MGYDRDRFQSEVDEEFICPICSDVLEDPVMVPGCEHTFCKECINQWFVEQNSCPIDRQPITPGELQPVPRILRNFLSCLLITCDYANLGCEVIVNLECLKTHGKECEHNPNRRVPRKYGCGPVITKDKRQDFRGRKLRSRLRRPEQRINEIREDASLTHAEDCIRAVQYAHPVFSTSYQLSDEVRNLSWLHSLDRGRVTNWDYLRAYPDSIMQSRVKRALSQSGCPLRLTVELVKNSHVEGWPPGLRALEARVTCYRSRMANRRYYENYYCRKIPGEQAIVITAFDNPHMNGNMVLEPGLVIIFSHGIDVPKQLICRI